MRGKLEGAVIILVGGGLGLLMVALGPGHAIDSSKWQCLIPCLALVVVGVAKVLGLSLRRIHIREIRFFGVVIRLGRRRARPQAPSVPPKTLTQADKKEREDYAGTVRIPGLQVSSFRVLTSIPDLKRYPSSDVMVPMYMLDSDFRILDWNDAFSLAFDYTMEGRRGDSVVTWCFWLDNWKQVIDHGVDVFSEDRPHPAIDVELIEYTSAAYGKLRAKKRAFKIPKDDGSTFGWLVTLEIEFEVEEMRLAYERRLLSVLRANLMWSDYAISYDAVLTNTKVYPQLLDCLLEGYDGQNSIRSGVRVLDLGAGTGNVTERLAESGKERIVFAVENNSTMMEILRQKCRGRIQQNADTPGVIPIKQDIRSLYGLPDEYFDYVTGNNVLYNLDDADVLQCLGGVRRVLKKGGELRISGPRKDTRLGRLFLVIEKDLKRRGVFDNVRDHFDRVREINESHLSPCFRWSLRDLEDLVRRSGFVVTYSTERAYAKQAMVIFATKR